jgi:hypothetical protein
MTDKFEKSNVLGKNVRPMDKFQQNDQLRRDIYFEIRALNKTLHTNYKDSQHAAIIEKFIDSMIPSKTGDDPGKLPVCASKPMAPRKNKALCVFYLVSCLIQSYWAYLQDESDVRLNIVKRGLAVLRNVNKNYDKMKLNGDERRGYVLGD